MRISLKIAHVPFDQYATVHNLTIELIEGITNFMGAIAFLDDRWVAAVMQRARFTDPEFVRPENCTCRVLRADLSSAARSNVDDIPASFDGAQDRRLAAICVYAARGPAAQTASRPSSHTAR